MGPASTEIVGSGLTYQMAQCMEQAKYPIWEF
jgi:hypothetical protein